MCTERARRRPVALAATLALGACNGTTSYLDATGAAGRAEGTLGVWLTAVASAVVVIGCAAILAGIARHRGDGAEEHDAPTRGAGADAHRREIASGLNWIYVGLALTVVVLVATFAGTMVTLNAASRPPRTPSLTMDVI